MNDIEKEKSIDVKKEKKVEYNRKYYENHKEKISEKLLCEICGCEYQKYSKSSHERSKKHALFSKKIAEIKKDIN